MASDGRHERLTKREVARLEKERMKLEKNLAGIKGMKTVPDAIFVIDTRKEVDRRPGSAQAQDPGGRHRRHQLRSGRGRLRGPGQRRRAARDPPLRGPRGRRGARRTWPARVARGRRRPPPTRARPAARRATPGRRRPKTRPAGAATPRRPRSPVQRTATAAEPATALPRSPFSRAAALGRGARARHRPKESTWKSRRRWCASSGKRPEPE